MPDRSNAVKVEGISKLNRNLKRMDAALPAEMKEIHRELAEPIAAEGSSRAPSRSGQLAASVRPNATPTSASVSAGARLRPYPYGPVVHYGGYPGDYAGQPFLTSVLESEAPRIADDYSAELDAFISRVWEDGGP
jgi:hypothetical protein